MKDMTLSELKAVRSIFETPQETEARKERQKAEARKERQKAEDFERTVEEIKAKAQVQISKDLEKIFAH